MSGWWYTVRYIINNTTGIKTLNVWLEYGEYNCNKKQAAGLDAAVHCIPIFWVRVMQMSPLIFKCQTNFPLSQLIFQLRHGTKLQLLQLLSHKPRSPEISCSRERDIRQLHVSSKNTSSTSGLISRWWQIHWFRSKKFNLVQISVRDVRLSDHTRAWRWVIVCSPLTESFFFIWTPQRDVG